ncbi:hypothetical protein BDV96DRAFT_507203 [Lophiotrema nucula]|uniref:PH domain-like protein n=1 Tax=Lophiotrema nucula TaxID=690887 RepID=A0A6A5YHM7_9PLEO|nr:hypothetical protein BDV96DRAFT_507203 [Lophiotrema nucula]
MPANKGKHRAHQQQHQAAPQPSDYETDAAPQTDLPPPPPRSNEQLNLSVVRRRYPDVSDILHVTPYVGLYEFKLETQGWEKLDIDGTMFLCSLTASPVGADRFAVVILNRRGLTNFFLELKNDEDIEITDPYIILQEEKIYGLWIHSEAPPSSTAMAHVEGAAKIKEAAKQAAESRMAREELLARNGAQTVPEPVQESVAMGRQLSLRELFGQQRDQDAGFSVHVHNHNSTPRITGLSQPTGVQQDVLGQLFAKAKQDYNGVG